jgi:hypothetical protein
VDASVENPILSAVHIYSISQLESSGINTFQIADNNEENNPMLIEGNGPISENPPAHLPLKILGRDENHNYKSLVFQRLTTVNPSVGKEWYKKIHRKLIHTLTKAQQHNFRRMDHLIRQ